SKTVFKGNACVARRKNRAVRNGLFQELLVVVCRRDVTVQKYMRVNVDESGEHSSFREIDQLVTSRRCCSGRDGRNFVAFDEDNGVENGRIAPAVDQTPRANGDLLRRY